MYNVESFYEEIITKREINEMYKRKQILKKIHKDKNYEKKIMKELEYYNVKSIRIIRLEDINEKRDKN